MTEEKREGGRERGREGGRGNERRMEGEAHTIGGSPRK